MVVQPEPGSGMADAWLNPREAAALIGVGVTTLALWRRADTGPPYAVAGYHTYRYSRRDLKSWLRNRVVEPRPVQPQTAKKTRTGGRETARR